MRSRQREWPRRWSTQPAAPAPKAPEAAEVVEAEARLAAAELPAAAKAPLKDGSAPEGYTVKGNADSGLYHEPDGRWYDATVAEFWFKSAARRGRRLQEGRQRAKSTAKDGEDAAVSIHEKNPRDILIAPVVSEKSYGLLDENKYTFLVDPRREQDRDQDRRREGLRRQGRSR
jgi:hypothetical protein